MPDDAARQLTAALREHAGEFLRGVVSYEGDEYEILHIREDVRQYRLKSEVDDMIVHLQRESADGEAAFPFGAPNATVRFFDDAVVVHVPRDERTGTVVTLEPDATARIDGLVRECLDRL